MRYLQLLVIILILSSCGTGKIKYVRVKGQPQKVVAASDKTTTNAIQQNPISTSGQTTSTLEEVHSTSDEELEIRDVVFTSEENETELIVPETDSIDEEPDSKTEKLKAALKAEHKAIKGRRNLMLSVIFLGVSMIPLGFTSLLFIPAVVLLIIGAVQVGKANRSRYITAEGQRAIDRSRAYIITWIVWAALMLILTGIVILLFL